MKKGLLLILAVIIGFAINGGTFFIRPNTVSYSGFTIYTVTSYGYPEKYYQKDDFTYGDSVGFQPNTTTQFYFSKFMLDGLAWCGVTMLGVLTIQVIRKQVKAR